MYQMQLAYFILHNQLSVFITLNMLEAGRAFHVWPNMLFNFYVFESIAHCP